jgi:hypothetical protein
VWDSNPRRGFPRRITGAVLLPLSQHGVKWWSRRDSNPFETPIKRQCYPITSHDQKVVAVVRFELTRTLVSKTSGSANFPFVQSAIKWMRVGELHPIGQSYQDCISLAKLTRHKLEYPVGVEPPTFRFEGDCSNPLSYESVNNKLTPSLVRPTEVFVRFSAVAIGT